MVNGVLPVPYLEASTFLNHSFLHRLASSVGSWAGGPGFKPGQTNTPGL